MVDLKDFYGTIVVHRLIDFILLMRSKVFE